MSSLRAFINLVTIGPCLCIMTSVPALAQAQAASRFVFFHEFYGSRGYADPQATWDLQQGAANGLAFWPPVETGITKLASAYGAGLMLRLEGATGPAGMTATEIQKQRTNLETQAAAHPQLNFVWNLMPEWDQSGGPWVPQGRPDYSKLSKANAQAKFLNYYSTAYPLLRAYLNRPAADRPYQLAAATDYPQNTYSAYEMGVDLCMLERGNDELGDLSTGIAFLRGAARQYNRTWGIDLSTWRTSTGMATNYNNKNVLLGGWSASYMKRLYYAAFVSGASVIQNEAATYRNEAGQLNPFGAVTAEFADFALRRHPDGGSPVAATAFLIDHTSGFDPKHGVYNQTNSVWYGDISYSTGDFMTDNVFRLAYPNHWLHELAPGAPFADRAGVPNQAKFSSFLAAGGDSRPYEPMPFTRWGNNLDVITTNIQGSALSQYKTIVLLGELQLSARLRQDLLTWVGQGGTLLMNTAQMSSADESLSGFTVKSPVLRSAASSRWLSKDVSQVEPPYRYTPVRPVTAEVLAVNEFSDPILTRNNIGDGEVLVTTAEYMQSAVHDKLLAISTQLLDSLVARNALASIAGPPVEYIVNQAPGRIIVTMINNSGSDWSGAIAVPPVNSAAGAVRRTVTEYITDQPVLFGESDAGISVPALVPAYDVRIFGIENVVAAVPAASKVRRRQ